MQIIDRNKDYYDHLSHIYGIDKKITFDRRGSVIVSNESLLELIDVKDYRYSDTYYFFILEIGFVQYLIKVGKVKLKYQNEKLSSYNYNRVLSLQMKIAKVYHDNKHYYDTPLSIRRAYIKTIWKWDSDDKYIINDNFSDTIKEVGDSHIDLPILSNTKITSLITADEIWKELQNYISALNNDKDNDTIMNDIEKAEVHGFDKKTSFRHPIK